MFRDSCQGSTEKHLKAQCESERTCCEMAIDQPQKQNQIPDTLNPSFTGRLVTTLAAGFKFPQPKSNGSVTAKPWPPFMAGPR